MIPIKHLLHINNSIRDVFIALSNKEKMKKWYTTGVEGIFEKDEIITFEFVNLATFKFKIIFLVENQSIHLECVESEWDNVGHIIKYDLDENDGKTRVRYTYEGFSEMNDSYSNMNYSSGKYLESLRQFCQTGIGEAYGSSNYRS
tara:strand:- start:283 stop:717 length:435 start_codon:yes stop_codon:yes gene_type:complete